MNILKKLDEKYGNSSMWQFIKFNLVGYTTSIVQLILANLLPFFCDSIRTPLPPLLRPIFDPKVLFDAASPYVVDGVVTWGYVLPLFLSNFLGNIYGYLANMRVTFKTKGSRRSTVIYLIVLLILILISTWMQGRIVGLLAGGKLAHLARTIAAWAAGLFQFCVLFPLEKFVLFREEKK